MTATDITGAANGPIQQPARSNLEFGGLYEPHRSIAHLHRAKSE